MTTGRALRADGQLNRARIIGAAKEVIHAEGAHASLEAIARRADVGSATLHRHFPSRNALLQEVFRDAVRDVCEAAAAQPGNDSIAELDIWLEDTAAFIANNRGLSTTLFSARDGLTADDICVSDLLLNALMPLAERAKEDGTLRRDVTAREIMALTNAIGLATENDEPAARRLVHLAFTGIRH